MAKSPYDGKQGRPANKLSLLRQKLYQKAKQEPKFRFYTLYNHILRDDVLQEAWKRVRENKGAAGVDGVTFNDIESSEEGIEGLLNELKTELKERRYRPQPVRRIYIPKENGGERPLGIPTIRDRVVQMAVLLVIEPIFEADFLDCSYGFRPERNAHQALDAVSEKIKREHQEVYDLDLKQYFDSIPHGKLMNCLQMRISDRSLLKLIRLWLCATVKEEAKDDKPKWSKPKKGTPQGGVLSPLLANVYAHWFDKSFYSSQGPANWAKASLVRYADDIVITAKYIGPQIVQFVEEKIENWLGLEINKEKTHIIKMKEDKASLDFLGFTFRRDRSLHKPDTDYLNIVPAKKALARERDKIRKMTSYKSCYVPIPDLIDSINRHLRAWSNYFDHGYPRKAFREINDFVVLRLTRHLKRRSQRSLKPPQGMTYYQLLRRLGLIYL